MYGGRTIGGISSLKLPKLIRALEPIGSFWNRLDSRSSCASFNKLYEGLSAEMIPLFPLRVTGFVKPEMALQNNVIIASIISMADLSAQILALNLRSHLWLSKTLRLTGKSGLANV